ELERTVWSRCPVQTVNNRQTWDERCNLALLDDPAMPENIRRGVLSIEPTIAGLSPSLQDLVRKAATVRLKLQSVGIHGLVLGNGASATIVVDARLDERALDALTTRSREDYYAAVREYFGIVAA